LTVGASALLDADGLALARALALARLVPVAVSVGCARAAIDYACEYATQREAFGHPISGFQGVSFILVDAQMEAELCRLDLWRVAAALDGAADPTAVEHDVDRVVSAANEMVLRATRTALQVLGGHGFLTDHPVERWYRTAAALAALDFDPLDVPVSITERVVQ
jgi:alkylation response protein AidB-like acyl-CoA dehydrogenase